MNLKMLAKEVNLSGRCKLEWAKKDAEVDAKDEDSL